MESGSPNIFSHRLIWPVWVGCLLLLMTNCTAPVEPNSRERARNNEVYFPSAAFTHVYAARLKNPPESSIEGIILPDGRLSDQVLLPVRRLSPAHRADVSVAIASSSVVYTPGECFAPGHAIFWKENEKAVAALLLSFDCKTYRFEPATPVDLRDENIKRLRLVFEENGMIAEDS